MAGPGQVLIAVEAASLNFPDLLMVRGEYHVKPPFGPGTEFAGTMRPSARARRDTRWATA